MKHAIIGLFIPMALVTACEPAAKEAATAQSQQEFADEGDTKTVSALIDDAYMFAESCAKYGPDDPDDDSCARLKIVEVRLSRDHDMCPSQSDEAYVFEPCDYTDVEPAPVAKSTSKADDDIEALAAEVLRLDEACADAGGGISGSPDCDAAIAADERLKARGYCHDFQQGNAVVTCDKVLPPKDG